MSDVYEVTEKLENCHAKHVTYPLLPGDILVEQNDGSFYKTAPGLGITGFKLTPEKRATLKKLDRVPPFEIVGLMEYADSLAEPRP